MKKIYIVPLEEISTRYTAQWKWHLPKLLKQYISNDGLDYEVVEIEGEELASGDTTPGAFLDFFSTNAFKSSQLIKISKLFQQGVIKDGDQFIYTDAWNPTIIQLRYMAELMGINITIHGLWHAGSYDPHDFLGKRLDKKWSYKFEESLFRAIDVNYFATKFHLKMFFEKLLLSKYAYQYGFLGFDEMMLKLKGKAVITGWPMEYMRDILEPYKDIEKRDLILFPHRISPEKQPDIFQELSESMPEYKWIMCQEEKLSKDEYHKLLAQSKIVFSANLQETLGISLYEGAVLGAIPMAPDRLSYTEMYPPEFLYDGAWTSNFSSYMKNKDKIIKIIRHFIENYDIYREKVIETEEFLYKNFFNGYNLVNSVLNLK